MGVDAAVLKAVEVLVAKVKDVHIKSQCEMMVAHAGSQPVDAAAKASTRALVLRLEANRSKNTPHGTQALVDEVVLRMVPYLLGVRSPTQGPLASTGLGSVAISMDPFVAFPLAVFFEKNGIPILREKKMRDFGAARVVTVPHS